MWNSFEELQQTFTAALSLSSAVQQCNAKLSRFIFTAGGGGFVYFAICVVRLPSPAAAAAIPSMTTLGRAGNFPSQSAIRLRAKSAAF